MKANTCPQCGAQLFGDFSQCFVCGWGHAAGAPAAPAAAPPPVAPPVSFPAPAIPDTASLPPLTPVQQQPQPDIPAPPTVASFLDEYEAAPLESPPNPWIKIGLLAGGAVLALTCLIILGAIQVKASAALSTGSRELQQHLYASAAKTLRSAPKVLVYPPTYHRLQTQRKKAERWTEAYLVINDAKQALADQDPQHAIDLLKKVPSDYPDQKSVKSLLALAEKALTDPSALTNEAIAQAAPDGSENVAAITGDSSLSDLVDNSASIDSSTADSGTGLDSLAGNTTTYNPSSSGTTSTPTAPAPAPTPAPSGGSTSGGSGGTGTTPPPAPAPQPSLVLLRRMYWANAASNPSNVDHFYTTNSQEVSAGKDLVITVKTYSLVNTSTGGHLYNMPISGNSNVVPLYRYWSAYNTDHLYTTNPNFVAGNPSANYVREKVEGYIGVFNGSKCLAGNLPLYKVWNATTRDDFYSDSLSEIQSFEKNQGYAYQAIIGCVW